MQEFTTAAQDAIGDDRTLEFWIDKDNKAVERQVKCRMPNSGQLAMLMAGTGRGSGEMDYVSSTINFFLNLFEEEDAGYFEQRLFSGTDTFGIQEVEAIMRWMVQEWTARPTEQPSVSTPSQPSDGPNSMLPTAI